MVLVSKLSDASFMSFSRDAFSAMPNMNTWYFDAQTPRLRF